MTIYIRYSEGGVEKAAPLFKSTGRTGTGSQETIAHGLGAKPTLISVTPDLTDGSASVTGLGKDTTNIYVTVTSGKTYDVIAAVL